MLVCFVCIVIEDFSCNFLFDVVFFVILFEMLLNGCFVCLLFQVEIIRWVKLIVGGEFVDIEYWVFEGFEMVVVEDVVDIMSRLSEVELVVILKYVVSVIDLLVKNIVFLFCSIRVEL